MRILASFSSHIRVDGATKTWAVTTICRLMHTLFRSRFIQWQMPVVDFERQKIQRRDVKSSPKCAQASGISPPGSQDPNSLLIQPEFESTSDKVHHTSASNSLTGMEYDLRGVVPIVRVS